MKIATMPLEEIRSRMGADATDREAECMRHVLMFGDPLGRTDTDEYTDAAWFAFMEDAIYMAHRPRELMD